MRNRIQRSKLPAAALLVLALGGGACAHGRGVQAGDAREALEQRQAGFAGAMAAKDGQMASLFAGLIRLWACFAARSSAVRRATLRPGGATRG
ncbi:MAG: hypothetical protein H0X67_01485 [Acidobacteria bacterium]|nr:hypothetical protein [Acidobacteriota bacterium]